MRGLPGRADRPAWQVLAGTAVIGVAIGLLAVWGRSLLEITAPADLVIAVPTAIVLLAQLIRVTVADLPPAQYDPGAVPGGERVYFSELRRLERRLETASRDGDSYDRNVRPELVQLALDRLRWRHGVIPRANPLRAREILGETLWQLLTDPPEGAAPMTRSRLEAVVSQIERI